ncbi:MAG: low specificity L-threonine aldolase, partial [Ilumatobacter sp.]
TERLEARVREVFEHDGARVFPITSGTAGNAVGLSAMTPPWGAVVCHPTAHIVSNEPGSTSLFASGAQMLHVGGDRYLIDPDELHATLEHFPWRDPHNSQPSVISVTQPTDFGSVYDLSHLAKLTSIAKEHGMRGHLDGARFANALVHLGCSPADATWRSGIDVLTLGATKNGGLSAELIVSFDDAASEELFFRTKRAGHVTSKMRYQSAQVEAHLADDLWLRLARNSNEKMARLAAGLRGLDVQFVAEPQVNIVFVRLPDAAIDALEQSGVLFYRISPGVIRFVTSWQTTDDQVDGVVDRVRSALARA